MIDQNYPKYRLDNTMVQTNELSTVQKEQKMDATEISMLLIRLQSLSSYNATQPIPSNLVLSIRDGLTSIIQQISVIAPPISSHLADLRNALFSENIYHQFYISAVVYGQTLETVSVIKGQFYDVNQLDQLGCENLCHLLHPDIQRVSGKLYRDGSYAESACNAFIEIDSRLQKIYREKRPNTEKDISGLPLMNKIFADNDSVLEAGESTTQTGRDIQTGTRFLFAGAMAALRNPKSHHNITLGKEDCMRRLIFASMLMYKVDELVAHSNTNGKI